MEKTTIIGHIGKDAQLGSHNGKDVINFNVGVSRSWKDKDGIKHQSTNWYSCARWLNTGESKEIIKYLLKGTQVYVEGALQPSLYKTKENQTAIDLKLSVNVIKLLGSNKDNENTGNTDNNAAPAGNNFSDNDDLPS